MRLSARLERALRASGLSIAELARWCDDTSEATVRTWLLGREPRAYTAVRIDKALGYLEKEIARQGGRIVPLNIRQRDRGDYVRGIRGRYPTV